MKGSHTHTYIAMNACMFSHRTTAYMNSICSAHTWPSYECILARCTYTFLTRGICGRCSHVRILRTLYRRNYRTHIHTQTHKPLVICQKPTQAYTVWHTTNKLNSQGTFKTRAYMYAFHLCSHHHFTPTSREEVCMYVWYIREQWCIVSTV